MRYLIFVFLLSLSSVRPALPEELRGKVMCGYQGWFRVPEDGSGNGWHHYSTNRNFEPGNCSIDLWPDVSELPPEDRFATEFRHRDGRVAEVFSSIRPATISLHFKWMKEYGIDGVFLQRFAVSTRNRRLRETLDQVLTNCRKSAQAHGRSWALMYDLSGLRPGQMDTVIEDWKRLREELELANPESDPSYLSHNDKPLVAVWGLGFSDREPMLDEWEKLITFLKSDPEYGGVSVMLGVPTYWRTLERDAIKDARLHELVALADVVSPWTVGRYNSPEAAARHVERTAVGDLKWCREREIDFLPVSFPGFSWQNLLNSRGRSARLDEIPRLGGEFLWSQYWHYHRAGAEMLYVAMFDELDEATAIFKHSNDPPVGESSFLSDPKVPNDRYLWLTGEAGKLLKGDSTGYTAAMPRQAEPSKQGE